MTLLILPGKVYAHPARNSSGVLVKFSRPHSSLAQRLTISLNIFGNRVTLVDMNEAQSEQIEQTMEGAECTADFNIADRLVGCANIIISTARMNTTGILSELLRLTQVLGLNLILCLGTADMVQAACISLTQEVAREIYFGPPPIPSGTPPLTSTTPGPGQPSVPTPQPPTPVPPTAIPPTPVPPTEIPPTAIPPTPVPPTVIPQTPVPPTEQPPTPTPIPPGLSSGTWRDPFGGASYIGDSVTLQLVVQGSTVSGTMTGDSTGDSTNVQGQDGPLSLFSSTDQQMLNFVIQNYGSGTGIFLVYTNTSVFEGAYANSQYYAVLQQNGDLQGYWYFPNSQQDAGALDFNIIS